MATAQSGSSGGPGRPRQPAREVTRRVLDEATRQRRARKALESLEADNFHDDPHADLVMSKKALNLFQVCLHIKPSCPAKSASFSLPLFYFNLRFFRI